MAKSRFEARGAGQARQDRIGDLRGILKRFLLVSAALPPLLSFPSWAATWEIVPSLSVGETYTDNVSLSPDFSKQGDWVTEISPGISVAATGPRLRINATYNPEYVYYARGQRDNQIFQRGNALGNAELAEKLLFIDVGANVNQYDVSLQGPLTTSNVNATGNRATVETFFASPYLRRDFGSDVHAEARFTESGVNSDDDSSVHLNSLADRIELRLNSGPAYRLLTWNVDYVRETVDYESAQDTFAETTTLNARRLITSTVGLLAQVGYENYESGDTVPALEGLSWNAGLDWTPSPHTRLAATVGHRFYGDAYFLDFSHRTRLTTWSVVYSESVSSTRSEFFMPVTSTTSGYLHTLFSSQYPDPIARQKAVEEFISRTGLPLGLSSPTNFFSTQLALVKRWQASAGILGARNVLVASVFKQTSEGLGGDLTLSGAGDFGVSNTISQTGASLLWNLRLSAQYAWNLRAAFSRNEFLDTGEVDNLTMVEMGLTRQFQPKVSGSVSYRRQQNNSNQSASSYTENAVFATLTKRF